MPAADLDIINAFIEDDSLPGYSIITINWEVTNIGDAPMADADVEVRIWDVAAGDYVRFSGGLIRVFDTVDANQLDPGEVDTNEAASFVLPADLAAGDYQIELTVVGNPGVGESETNLTNNTELLDFTIEATTLEPETLDTLSDYLADGYWTDTGRAARSFDLSSDPLTGNSGIIKYNLTGFTDLPDDTSGREDLDGLTAARADLVREAFRYYETLLGIDFQEVSAQDDSVDLFFLDNDTGANATSYRYGAAPEYIDYAYINIASSWEGGQSDLDGYEYRTVLHEIGHTLGLGHQGNYNGASGEPHLLLDNWQISAMSYDSQADNLYINADEATNVTMMGADLLALEKIYGVQGYGPAAFGGDTVWGYNTTITAGESAIFADLASFAATNTFCIFDSGGIDTLDFSGESVAQLFDLAVTSASDSYVAASDVAGLVGNLTLAVGTVIENVVGGSRRDTVRGNEAENLLVGNGGHDILRGNGGNDDLRGNAGRDLLVGGGGADQLRGAGGNDTLDGSSGNDFLRGGRGADRFLFDQFANLGRDRIVDWEDGTDLLVVDGGGFADVTVRSVGAGGVNTRIDLDGGSKVILLGIDSATISDADFDFV